MRMPTILRMSALALLAGCYAVGMQPGQSSGVPGVGPYPSTDGTGNTPRGRPEMPSRASNQICRGAPVPRGWVVVDYVPGPGNCPPLSATEPGPNTALLAAIAPLPPETVLIVCADQHVPTNWSRADAEPSDATTSQCPRKPGDTRTGATVMRIRKQR